jgi:MOSC domain-containing protein YiiM
MIVGQKPYLLAKEHLNINLPSAALGENILLSFNPHELENGAILEIGSAILQITKICTLCKHLTKYHAKLPKLILKSRGIYCKVLQDGVIKVGSSVKILDRLSA